MAEKKKVVRMRDVYRVALGGTAPWCPKPKKLKDDEVKIVPATAVAPAVPADPPPPPATTPAPVTAPPPATAPAPVAAQGLDPVTPPDEFTPAQDEILLRMKTQENKSWKEIAEVLSKPAWALKKRLPILKSKDAEPEKGESSKKKGKSRKVESVPSIPLEVDVSEQGGVEYVFLDEDENFSREECELLARLHIQDADELFGRIASRFFDHTGRRLTAEEIQAKLGIK